MLWPQQGHHGSKATSAVSKHSSLCPSGIHRWHDVGARTDDHCPSRLWWLCLHLGNQKDYSFVTVSETSPGSQQTDLTLKQWVRETSAENARSFDTFWHFLDAGITSINESNRSSETAS